MLVGGTYTAWRFDTTRLEAGFRRVALALALFSASALADCPRCEDGLIGSGPVKVVCPWCQGACDKKPDTFQQVPVIRHNHLESVVRILSRHGDSASSGSGVVIEHDGKPAVLTARHVVFENGKPGTVTVFFQDGSESTASIVKHDDPFDLALLSCEKYGAVAVPLAASPKVGESIAVAGFGPAPHEFRESRGRVIGRSKPVGRYAADFIDISTPARQGDSGGPMFNEAGEVAGIVWGSTSGSAVGSHSGRLRAFLGQGDASAVAGCPNGRCPKR